MYNGSSAHAIVTQIGQIDVEVMDASFSSALRIWALPEWEVGEGVNACLDDLGALFILPESEH